MTYCLIGNIETHSVVVLSTPALPVSPDTEVYTIRFYIMQRILCHCPCSTMSTVLRMACMLIDCTLSLFTQYLFVVSSTNWKINSVRVWQIIHFVIVGVSLSAH